MRVKTDTMNDVTSTIMLESGDDYKLIAYTDAQNRWIESEKIEVGTPVYIHRGWEQKVGGFYWGMQARTDRLNVGDRGVVHSIMHHCIVFETDKGVRWIVPFYALEKIKDFKEDYRAFKDAREFEKQSHRLIFDPLTIKWLRATEFTNEGAKLGTRYYTYEQLLEFIFADSRRPVGVHVL